MVDLSFYAYPNVTLEDVVVLGECCPSGRDSSLNFLVLVFVLSVMRLRRFKTVLHYIKSMQSLVIFITHMYHISSFSYIMSD